MVTYIFSRQEVGRIIARTFVVKLYLLNILTYLTVSPFIHNLKELERELIQRVVRWGVGKRECAVPLNISLASELANLLSINIRVNS